MIFRFGLLLLLVLCLITACSDHAHTIERLVSNIQNEYRPDKRVAIFDAEIHKRKDGYVLKGKSNLPEAMKALFKELASISAPIVDSMTLLPLSELGDKVFGIVVVSVANIRSRPGHSEELSTQALMGTPLRIYEKKDGWYMVQTPDNYLGWLDNDAFVLKTKEEMDTWRLSTKIICFDDYGFILSEKGGGARVCDWVQGSIFQVIDEGNEWLEVRLADGRSGFLRKASAKKTDQWMVEDRPNSDDLIKTAQSFLGRPYLWGGTSGKGVDCSGFTKSVFFMHGLSIPRDASQQVHCGVEVDTDTSTFKNLLPGDLLFFGRGATNSKKERITHVAIYMGDMKIIHSAGMVKIESLRKGDEDFSGDRLKTFVRARRLTETPGEHGTLRVGDVGY